MFAIFHRARAVPACISLILLVFTANSFAEQFVLTPSRVVGPHTIGQTSPEPMGGWSVSDDRTLGASVIGQGGWTGTCSYLNYDQEITAGIAHSGGHGWRLSNWYHDGCVNHVISTPYSPAGEIGSTTAYNGGGVGPTTNSVDYDFWFRSASVQADPGVFTSTTITDQQGRRMTYLGFFDEPAGPGGEQGNGCPTDNGCFHLDASGVTNGGTPGDDSTVVFDDNYSPALERGRWYRVHIDATFNDTIGESTRRNDVVNYVLYDSAGNEVWSALGKNTWEDAYYEGHYGSNLEDKVASNYIAYRISANPDTGDQSDGDTYSVVNRTRGIVFDDLSVVPGDGQPGFKTSFDFDRYVATNGSDNTTCTDKTNPCLTIAYAITQSNPYDTIHVAAGRYVERTNATTNLTINKPVAIEGAQVGIDARSRSDVGATIIVPGVAESGLNYGSTNTAVVNIASNGVSLDGLIIDTDNPAITTGLGLNGTDPDVSSDVFAAGNNITIQNTVLRNAIFAGIYADNNDGHVTTPGGDNLIQLNRFTNITNPSTWGIGVYAGDNFYAQITDNLLDQVRVGIQFAESDNAADPGTQIPSVSRNEIHATRTGMFFNLFSGQATTWTVSDNHVIASANAQQANEWNGMQIESMEDNQTANISGNVIDGSAVLGARRAVGYVLNNIISTLSANTAIDGGSVSNVDVGVLSTDATNYTGPVNGFLVRNVAFNDVSLAAFYVEDTDQIAGSATLNIGMGNSYTSVAHQLALSGANATSSGGVADVLVRAAGNYFFTIANNNSCSTVCTTSNASINAGIAAAAIDGTVYVENATFNEGVVIGTGKDGVRLTANDAANPPTLTRSTGGANQPVLIVSGGASTAPKNVTVDHLNFLVDKVHAGEGVLASGFVDGLTIDSNTFTQIASASSGFARYSYTNAIAVNIDPGHNSAALPRVDGSMVSITNNTIVGSTSPNATQFRAGIAVDASVGVISGNHSSGLNHDALVRFATQVSGGSNGWLISGNTFTGGGLEFDAPNAGITPITIDSNTIVSESTPPALAAGALSQSQQHVEADFSALRLIDNSQNLPITVSNNVISGYANGMRGALVENFPNATFVGNTFSPLTGAGDFASLVVSNREINTDNPPERPYPMSFTALQNTFNDSGVSGVGRAVEFIDDNDANGTAVFNSIKFGSSQASDANTFGAGHQFYFNLVDQSCDTNLASVGVAPGPVTPGGASPQCMFLDYNGVNSPGGLPNTQVRPFRGNVYAVNNLFAGLMPHAMPPVQQAALNQQTFDINDDASLGLVNYGFNGAVDINLQGPVANVQVGVATDYSAELTNTGNALSENVLIQFSIHRTSAISTGDIALQYFDGSSYQTLPLSPCSAGLCGAFGPQPGGFPVAAAYDAITKLRATFAVADTFTVTAQLQGVSSGVIYASDTLSTQVVQSAAKIGLALSGPQTAAVGAAVGGYSARLTNTGGATAENVLVHFVVSRSGGIVAGDLTIQYFNGSSYQTIPLTVCPAGLCGTFGPQSGGFPVAVGYDQTTQLQTIYAKSGVFTITSTVDGVNTSMQYASSSLQVTVGAGVAANIAANSPTSLTGTAGTPVTPLPSVIVTDSLGNPVAGYAITFVAGSNSGTLSGTSQVTDANGVATVGGWILGTASTETVTVTNSLNGSPVTFTATVSAEFDLAVSITDNHDYIQYGHTLDYAIVVSNAGPSTASRLVTDNLPPELDVTGATWVCLAHTTGATCTASGTGNLSDTPTIPSGGSVTYVLSANVLANTSDESVVNQVTVDATGDSDPSNNSATSTTTIVIFRDGFELGSGSVGSTDSVGTLDDNATLALDPNSVPKAGSSPVVWLRAVDAQQREAFRVEVVTGSDGTLVRVVTRNAAGTESHSAWTPLKTAALGVTGKSGSYNAMLVVSGGGGLEAAIPSWAVLPITLQSAE